MRRPLAPVPLSEATWCTDCACTAERIGDGAHRGLRHVVYQCPGCRAAWTLYPAEEPADA